MADDRSRGVHLTDKQLVFAFMSATVIAVVVFLFGVLVGRGVQAARGPLNDAAARPAPSVLSDGAAGEPPIGDPAIPSGATTPAPSASEFSYPGRLGNAPPSERLKQSAAAPAPVSLPRESATAPDVPADGAGTPETAEPTGDYTVQVTAVKKQAEADRIVKDLKSQGYEAFVLAPDANDRLGLFRVRVGSFKDKQKAAVLAQRLSREGKGYRPWVTTR